MRIVIVEDHAMFRELLCKFCTCELGGSVVGEADSGLGAMRVIQETQPDLLMLDLHLPDGDGFEVADYARRHWPSMRILMLSSHSNDYTLFRVEQSKAHGFIDKNTKTLNCLHEAFAAFSRGETFYSRAYLDAKIARSKDPRNFSKILSGRECVILSLIGLSLSDDEIAQRLSISPATVQTHRSHIMLKLNISGSTKLAKYALEHGFARLVTCRNDESVFS